MNLGTMFTAIDIGGVMGELERALSAPTQTNMRNES